MSTSGGLALQTTVLLLLTNMKISQKGLDLIKKFEGFRNTAYLCPAKVWTIGYGATYYPNGKRVQAGDKITEAEASKLLFDMANKNYALPVDKMTRDDITQNQFDALVSLVYNIGVGNFQKSTVLRLVNKNPKDPKIADAFMMWNIGGGKVLPGLVRRRKEESKLYYE